MVPRFREKAGNCLRPPGDYLGVNRSRPRSGGALFAPVALIVGALLLAACGGDDGGTGDAEPFGSVRVPPLQVEGVELPDESPEGGGRPFAIRAGTDGLLLVYFGYTSCPDICPTTLSDIGAALRRLTAPQRARVEVAMITIDPERDTGEVITSFLEHFVEGGHALRTTDPEVLGDALDAFRAVARQSGSGESYDFEHTATVFVVDGGGTVALEWAFGTAAEDISSDLGLLLDRIDSGEPLVDTSGG